MKLTGFVTTTALTLTLASAALAGSLSETPAEPMMEPVEVVESSIDWSGFYGGLSVGKTSGDFDFLLDSVSYQNNDLSGTPMGVFAGYNFQRGSMVYGLELAMSKDVAEFENLVGLNDYPTMNDLKLRIGYAPNNVLYYGFAGRSKGKFMLADNRTEYDTSGSNFGIGAEMVFSEHWLVGVEAMLRNVEGDLVPPFPVNNTGEADIRTLQLRVGYKF